MKLLLENFDTDGPPIQREVEIEGPNIAGSYLRDEDGTVLAHFWLQPDEKLPKGERANELNAIVGEWVLVEDGSRWTDISFG